MKTITTIIFVIIILCGCHNSKKTTKDNITYVRYEGDGVYTEEGRKRILKEYGSWFNYIYRQDFNHRRSDNSYLLCNIISLENISDGLPDIQRISGYNDSVIIVYLKIKPFELYFTPEDFTPELFNAKMLKEEYCKEKDYGCKKMLNDIRKRLFSYPEERSVYLLILKNELEGLQYDMHHSNPVLMQFYDSFQGIRFDSSNAVYSRIYYPYGSYDLSKLIARDSWYLYYDSIDKKVREEIMQERGEHLLER